MNVSSSADFSVMLGLILLWLCRMYAIYFDWIYHKQLYGIWLGFCYLPKSVALKSGTFVKVQLKGDSIFSLLSEFFLR